MVHYQLILRKHFLVIHKLKYNEIHTYRNRRNQVERSCRRRLTDPAFEEGKIVSGLKYGKSEGILQFSGPRNKSEME